MPMTVEQLAAEALSLPREERAKLAEQLFESLDTGDLTDIEKLWADEAKRRADQFASGKVQGIPGEKVLAEARRRAG